MNTKSEAEMVLELVPELEAQGYEVYLQPSRPIAPAFLGSFRPDIVARSNTENLVIEVARKDGVSEKRLKDIAKLFQEHSDWKFRIVWIDPTSTDKTIRIESKDVIERRLTEARTIAKDHPGPALLLSWAVFEAIGRALVSGEFSRPQTPGRLVEVLAGRGIVTPSEADEIRELISKRNAFVHGALETAVTPNEVERFARILTSLAGSLESV